MNRAAVSAITIAIALVSLPQLALFGANTVSAQPAANATAVKAVSVSIDRSSPAPLPMTRRGEGTKVADYLCGSWTNGTYCSDSGVCCANYNYNPARPYCCSSGSSCDSYGGCN